MKVCDVTVVIPNYDRTKVLRRALKSIESQTCRPSEVIVVDDHSSADNLSIIKAIINEFRGNFKVTLLVNERNYGANYSRNRGILFASCKFIAFLDSDDIWMPNKLERQMEEIDKSKVSDNRPILSATGRYRVDGAGEIIARQFSGRLLNPDTIRRSNFIGTLSSVVVETWIARHIHGFNESLSACQDWEFFIRLANYVQYVGVRDPLCIYVDHNEERITLNNKNRLKAHLFIYKNYIKDFPQNDRSFRAEFYRNIAEDYQTIGNEKKANLFYARHKSLQEFMLSFLVPSVFWFLLYKVRKSPRIKELRYVGYKRNLAKQVDSVKDRKKMERDGSFIRKMMALP